MPDFVLGADMNKDEILQIAGEPVAWRYESRGWYRYRGERKDFDKEYPILKPEPLYTESQLLAAYAKGAESSKADGWRQCAVGQRTTQFCGQVEAEKAKAYAKGAEDRAAWQPIETAPKDGARILLARIGKNEIGKDLGIWWACRGWWSDKWKCWYDGVEPSGLAKPTHWMPLPAPPTEGEQ